MTDVKFFGWDDIMTVAIAHFSKKSRAENEPEVQSIYHLHFLFEQTGAKTINHNDEKKSMRLLARKSKKMAKHKSSKLFG